MLASLALKQQKNIVMTTQRAFAYKHSDQPKRVIVTGAAGNISYAILFRIARYAHLTF